MTKEEKEALKKLLNEAASALESYANRSGGTNILTPKLRWYAKKL